MRVIVISSDYPRPDLIYGDTFVQARVRLYKLHHEVIVVGYKPELDGDREFVLEDVSVFIYKKIRDFCTRITDYNPDIIAAHLVHYSYIPFLIGIKKPLVVFVHGFEAMSWTRRLMNYTHFGDLPYLLPFIVHNRRQQAGMRELIKYANTNSDICFVFVSSWLKVATESDLGIEIRNSRIIPNGIDTRVFSYVKKSENLRKRILVLRSFRARNYANDVAMEAIISLSKKTFFPELEFTIYGEGHLYSMLTNRIKHFPNVKLNNYFVLNHDIPAIHIQHGIFLCPSRLDTQGVSMCEAMASGLIPITSPIGGIPEYSEDSLDSFHVKGAKEIASRIEYLFYNPGKYLEMSQNARLSVERKCSLRQTTNTEMELFESVLK